MSSAGCFAINMRAIQTMMRENEVISGSLFLLCPTMRFFDLKRVLKLMVLLFLPLYLGLLLFAFFSQTA